MRREDDKAKEYAALAIGLDPKLYAAHELMAGLALEDGDTKKATAEADEALKLFRMRWTRCNPCGDGVECGPIPDAWLAKFMR